MKPTCCSTFIANWGVMAPLVISSSSESVNAMPILWVRVKSLKCSLVGSGNIWKDVRRSTVKFVVCWCHPNTRLSVRCLQIFSKWMASKTENSRTDRSQSQVLHLLSLTLNDKSPGVTGTIWKFRLVTICPEVPWIVGVYDLDDLVCRQYRGAFLTLESLRR